MASTEKLDTHHKALALNLDPSTFGSFAEIGAGQEVARWFLVVGGASGTVAKTISAYDKEVSDDLYGAGSRYVSKHRLQAMLDKEWSELLAQLGTTRGRQTRFFSFADTVTARNYAGTNEANGWLGLRFQLEPSGIPQDILLHINLRDSTTPLQQEAIGILGVNLIFAAFYQSKTRQDFLEGLTQDVVRERIEIDFLETRGPFFSEWDRKVLLTHLVQAGYAEAVWFSAKEEAGPPSEVLYKKAVVLAPGYFGHVDADRKQIHSKMMARGLEELEKEFGEALPALVGLFCLAAAAPAPDVSPPDIPDLLRRVNALLANGNDVLLFRERELYTMTGFMNRHTKEPVRLVVGLSLIIRAFDDPYGNLQGRRLEALARLFAQNVRIYAFPMAAKDLDNWMRENSVKDWEWSEKDGQVSADQLRPRPPLGHLYSYLLANGFLVPMNAPSDLAATAQVGT